MLPFRELEKIPGVEVFRDVPLNRFTTFRIGGPAQIMLVPRDIDALERVLAFSGRNGFPLHILGRGSNLLVNDSGVGAVLSLSGLSGIGLVDGKAARDAQGESIIVEAGAGCSLRRLVTWSASRGLEGLAGLAGIPASVGGAMFMNAGASGITFGSLVEQVLITTPEGSSWFNRDDLELGYRSTTLPERGVVASVRIRLVKGNTAIERRKIAEVMRRRCQSQPLGQASAGCVFRNFSDMPAGLLIDRCGLKGMRQGDAMVSMRHANFIVNAGRATCSDVAGLMDKVRERVLRETGRVLETEVRYWN